MSFEEILFINTNNKAELNNVKKDFDQKIAQAKHDKNANKEELAAKYKPLIAETKAKYQEKNKEAKETVSNAKKQYYQEYLDEYDSGVDIVVTKNID